MTQPQRHHSGSRLLFWLDTGWAAGMTILAAAGSVTHQLVSRDKSVFRWWSLFWSRSMFLGMGIRVHVTYRERLDPRQPCVFVLNHQVAIDIPVASCVIPGPFGWVAKAELERTPVLGAAIRASPSIFLDRSTPRRSAESLRRAGKQIRSGLSVAIFPEGARSYGPGLGSFKRGAFLLALEAGVPVVPITVVNAWDLVNEKHRRARWGMVHVVSGHPIPVSGMTRDHVDSLMKQVRDQMQTELDRWNAEAGPRRLGQN